MLTVNPFTAALDGWTEDQWTQHTTGLQTMCIGGRLVLANHRREVRTLDGTLPEWAFLCDLIRRETGQSYISVQQWNDQPGRTFAQVRDMLVRAELAWDHAHSRVLVDA